MQDAYCLFTCLREYEGLVLWNYIYSASAVIACVDYTTCLGVIYWI